MQTGLDADTRVFQLHSRLHRCFTRVPHHSLRALCVQMARIGPALVAEAVESDLVSAKIFFMPPKAQQQRRYASLGFKHHRNTVVYGLQFL